MKKAAISTILGIKVRQARLERQLGVSEFAEMCALSPSYVAEIEKGRKYPKPDKIARMAEILKVPYDSLVSIKLEPSQQYLETFLSSPVLQEFPFDLFGLDTGSLVELITRAPTRASALIHALLEVARQYDFRTEYFFRAGLRSYQEIHHNYFPDLEEAAESFLRDRGLEQEQPLSLETLTSLLSELLGYEIDEQVIPQLSDLRGYRSIFLPRKPPTLLINPRLDPMQKKFLLARELGYAQLKLQQRALTSSPDVQESFQQVLNDFRASYFGGALLMPRERMVADLNEFFALPGWNPERMRSFLPRYDVTPEMLLYRFSELIPEFFGLHLHFLRFHDIHGEYRLTKQLNMSQVMIPSGLGLHEHHCRRWLSYKLLDSLAKLRSSGGPFPIVAAQRSEFLDSGDAFICIGFARPLTLSPDVGSSVIIGFRHEDKLLETIRFASDPTIERDIINETCERCPLDQERCRWRVAPPIIYEQQNSMKRRQEAVEKLLRQFKVPTLD
ncbi:MAG: ImmA/IrrE family metallo-endopeptidase [Acidobacteria bacterium]|nr:ImmA/IrrE family metallo-endopeptidase [Acidobacteriota bacterium]